MLGRGQCTLETVHERKGNRRKWYRQTDRQTGGHRVTVRIPSKKRGRITQHACRNRFRTLSLLDISIFFLSGRLARRVPRKMGVRIPHARGTRVCVRQKGCASLTTPSSPSRPKYSLSGEYRCAQREKKEIEKKRERALLIDDALILRKRCGFIEAWRISEFRSIAWAKRGERTKKSGATGIEKKNAKKTKGKERMKKEERRQGKSGPRLKTSSIDSPPAQYPWKAQRASVIAMEVMNKVNNHVQSPLKYFLSNVEAARVMGWRLNFNGASRRRCRSIGYRRVANVLQNRTGERWHWKFRCRKTSAVLNG